MVSSSNGAEVAVHECGGQGPPLVLTHATGFCGLAYEPVITILRSRFSVWAIDLRGHGRSSMPTDGDFGWLRIADDVLAAVDLIDSDEGVAGFGHSLGGAVLLHAAAARPGTLRTAYVYEPILWPPGQGLAPGQNPLADGARRRREVFENRGEVMMRFASRAPFGLLRADALHAYVTHGFEDLDDGSVRLRCRGETEASIYDAEEVSTWDRVASVDIPVLAAMGGSGPELGPARLTPHVVDALPDARLSVHDRLGHFGPFEDPAAIAAEAIRFLAGEETR
jgi:pimeloyl-ACP methyl ester carboxylesterase